jgi:hypothetical protein
VHCRVFDLSDLRYHLAPFLSIVALDGHLSIPLHRAMMGTAAVAIGTAGQVRAPGGKLLNL